MIETVKNAAIKYAGPKLLPYAMPLAKWWYGKSSPPGSGRRWVLSKVRIIDEEHGDVVDLIDCDISFDSPVKEAYAKLVPYVPEEWTDFRFELRYSKGAQKLTKRRLVLRAETIDSDTTIRGLITSKPLVQFTAAVLDLGTNMEKFNILKRTRKYVLVREFDVFVKDLFPMDDLESIRDGRFCRFQTTDSSGKIHNRRLDMESKMNQLIDTAAAAAS